MGYDYTTRDGNRVEVHVAAAFDKLNAAFHAAFGLQLVVSSGTRTYDEQKAIFLARYVTAGNINGRKVYDTRWWNGVLYYRISSAGTVAQPGTSNHEDDGPIGPRAIDIRDTGSDAGVTSYGNSRSAWIKAHAGEYGFATTGYDSYNEPWHIEYQGSLTGAVDNGTTTTGEWDEMATKDEIRDVTNTLAGGGGVIVSYASSGSRNGIVLASLGFWKKFTGEQWGNGMIQSMLANYKVYTPTNDREYDLIRALCSPEDSDVALNDAQISTIASAVATAVQAAGTTDVAEAVKTALLGLEFVSKAAVAA